MRFLLCLALAACSSPLKAQVALNSYTGRYEIAPHNAVPQLNPFTGNFELASPGSVPKFNSFQRKWQMAPRNSVPRFNQYSEKWKWRLLMRGSRLIPIRVSGIITARRAGTCAGCLSTGSGRSSFNRQRNGGGATQPTAQRQPRTLQAVPHPLRAVVGQNIF
jgi:hypothetical protein